MLPSACSFVVDGLTFSCRCSTLRVSAYMAIFRCVCFTFIFLKESASLILLPFFARGYTMHVCLTDNKERQKANTHTRIRKLTKTQHKPDRQQGKAKSKHAHKNQETEQTRQTTRKGRNANTQTRIRKLNKPNRQQGKAGTQTSTQESGN
jgi:hypothetical protein